MDNTDVFNIDPETGQISFLPTQEDVGTHHVTVTVHDGNGGFADVSFDLVVENVNDEPVIELVMPKDGSHFKEGQTIGFAALATDEDDDPLTYVWSSGDKEMGTGDSLDYKKLKAGTHTVKLVVSDGISSVDWELQVTVDGGDGPVGLLVIGSILGIIVVVLALLTATYIVKRKRSMKEPVSEEEDEEESDDNSDM
jgi:hypothetical protein